MRTFILATALAVFCAASSATQVTAQNEDNAVLSRGLHLCNKSFDQINVSVISTSYLESYHERFVGIRNGECVSPQNTSGSTVRLNVQTSMQPNGDFVILTPDFGKKSAAKIEESTEVFCSFVDESGFRLGQDIFDHKYCYKKQNLLLYNTLIHMPDNLIFTLSF